MIVNERLFILYHDERLFILEKFKHNTEESELDKKSDLQSVICLYILIINTDYIFTYVSILNYNSFVCMVKLVLYV